METNGERLQTPSQPINKSHSDTEILTSSSAAHLGANVGEINPGQASPKIYISDSSNTGVMSMSYGGSSPQEGSPLNAMNTCQIRSSDNVYLDSVPSSDLGLNTRIFSCVSIQHSFYVFKLMWSDNVLACISDF